MKTKLKLKLKPKQLQLDEEGARADGVDSAERRAKNEERRSMCEAIKWANK